ncbi:MAG: hypothetical protein U9P61_02485 [Patescibacteria group bacterium]|nr:hypothetical protein [Patescibacteria group bacterium]
MAKIIKNSFLKTLNGFAKLIPVIISVILFISLIIAVVPKSFYSKIFTGNIALDSLTAGILGSISVGNPMVSYIIGGEILAERVNLIAITVFLLTWISVGVVGLPVEIKALGKRFAITRNILSFLTAFIIAGLTVLTISFL